jgi:two-component system NarL family response regulator
MSNRTKIAIADDHKIFAEGIQSVLKDQDWITWVGEAFTAKDAYQLYKVAKRILHKYPNAAIIILSMENNNDFMHQSKLLGVKGYIIKNLSSSESIEIIEQIIKGNNVFMWGEELQTKLKQEDGGLSKREKEIIALISKGLNSQEIANAISLSVLTINTHRRNILRKLNLKNIAMVVQYARVNRL